MQYEAIFTEIYDEIFPENLEFLSVYRKRRASEFPGVPVRQFSDWQAHREWMRKQRDTYLRMANNHRILDEVEQQEADEKKGG